jgi:Beige/BEACH domain
MMITSIVFHPFTYEGSIDLDKIDDPVKRQSITLQINEFGQTPRQLFAKAHPGRYENIGIPKDLFIQPKNIQQQTPVSSEKKKESIDYSDSKKSFEKKSEESKSTDREQLSSFPETSSFPDESIWNASNLKRLSTSYISKVHKRYLNNLSFRSSEISALCPLSDNRILTVGHDGFIKITQYQENNVARSFKVCDITLSSVTELKKNELYAVDKFCVLTLAWSLG